jgi:hypothetical protein
MSEPLEPRDARVVIVKQILEGGHMIGDGLETGFKVIKPACEMSPLTNGGARVSLMSFRHSAPFVAVQADLVNSYGRERIVGLGWGG